MILGGASSVLVAVVVFFSVQPVAVPGAWQMNPTVQFPGRVMGTFVLELAFVTTNVAGMLLLRAFLTLVHVVTHLLAIPAVFAYMGPGGQKDGLFRYCYGEAGMQVGGKGVVGKEMQVVPSSYLFPVVPYKLLGGKVEFKNCLVMFVMMGQAQSRASRKSQKKSYLQLCYQGGVADRKLKENQMSRGALSPHLWACIGSLPPMTTLAHLAKGFLAVFAYEGMPGGLLL
ncbi:hypothetical protein BDF14DRAFT_1886491 [Spinellus fusiger]|nr:hypothetical protein BDF14DRAFT_1886491 [Spinellus fusiger]